MKRALLLLAAPLMLAAVASGCGGWITVDGYEAEYASAPASIERYPRHAYRDGYVYEVDGRYYRRYQNRWVVYRKQPGDLRRDHNGPGRDGPGRDGPGRDGPGRDGPGRDRR